MAVRSRSFTAVEAAQIAVFWRSTGFSEGIEAIQRAGEAMLPGARKVWRTPAFAALEKARAEIAESPCRSLACGGRCSRCVRANAVAANRKRFGTVDYPDETTRTAVLRGVS
jgi:hypothetical protein